MSFVRVTGVGARIIPAVGPTPATGRAPEMPRRQPRSRALLLDTTWPVGIALTSWQYLWRTTPMHRREEPGRFPDDAPPALTDAVAKEELQGHELGVGPLFHRRYRARVHHAQLSPEGLIEQ